MNEIRISTQEGPLRDRLSLRAIFLFLELLLTFLERKSSAIFLSTLKEGELGNSE